MTTSIVPPLKRCRKCGEEKPSYLFGANKRRKDGLDCRCKTCLGTAKPRMSHVLVPLGSKRCTTCGNIYPATKENFSCDARQKDGLKSQCRECRLKDMAEYCDKNRDECRASSLRWYHNKVEADPTYSARHSREQRDRDPEKARARRRKFYHENKAKEREQHANWVKKNKTKRQEYMKDWYKLNPIAARQYNARRRARERSQGTGYTVTEIMLQYRSQRGKCWHCGLWVGNHYHVDHLIPLDRGGKHDASNIVISCPRCNLSKGKKLTQEWNGRLF